MAEWLRRLTANQLGSAREGSNPSVREAIFFGLFDPISGRGSPPEHFGANRIPKFPAVPEIWPF